MCRIVGMAPLEGKDFTVAELRDALRERGLISSGPKTELISRLSTADPNIWAILSEKRNQASRAEDASTSGSVREDMDESINSEGDATILEGRPETRPLQSEESDDLVSRELALFEERERELIEREQQLLRREREMARSTSASSNAVFATGGVRNLKDLLPEFDATENTFWR